MTDIRGQSFLNNHPCFNKEASANWGRVHLPVAPDCNIQCNFCNRIYDCANENRPGVTQHVYTPDEAVDMLEKLFARRQDISVVGIAGPGDPMCDADKTISTFEKMRAHFPRVMLCLSSNGLALPEYVDELGEIGISHVTVTVNAVRPEVGADVYAFVRHEGRTYTGIEGAEILLDRQDEAIRRLKENKLIVKINTVVIPGVNMEHIPEIAAKASAWGADIMNCISMIPVHDTPFAGKTAPTDKELHRIRQFIGQVMPQMTHCCRCRADACGKLGAE